MTLIDIAKMPTSVDSIPPGCKGVHESTLKAYHILMLVKQWLGDGVPAHVILDVVAELEQPFVFEYAFAAGNGLCSTHSGGPHPIEKSCRDWRPESV